MGKIKEWVKNHENVIIGGAIGGLCAGVGAYIGYKFGFRKGFEYGEAFVPAKALVKTGIKAAKDLGGLEYRLAYNKLDTNMDDLMATMSDLIATLPEHGGDPENTALIAVSLVPGTH